MSSIEDIRGEPEQKKTTSKKALLAVFVVFLVLFIGLWIVYFVFHPVTVIGPSMEPTYHGGQFLMTKTSFDREDISYGTVVVFYSPENGQKLIKRVVALPGDTVEVKKEGVWLNGKPTNDEFGGAINETTGEIRLTTDSYYVLGDNRNNSVDSRSFGPIRFDDIANIVR